MELKVNFDINIVLKFLKRTKMLLVPIAICVVAFLLLIPTVMIGKSVKEKTEQSKRTGEEITRMLSSGKSYSRQQVSVAENYANRYQQDVDELLGLARQTTQRELISYSIFPKPATTSTQVYTNYGKSYRAQIESMMEKLGGRDAPSEIEKDNATAHLGAAAARNDMEGGMSRRTLRNIGSRTGKNDALDNVLDALCQKRAAEIPIYANISLFRWYDFWNDYTYVDDNTALKDCWDSQLAYWIYQDVVDTIVNVNSNSSRVHDSVVKRLIDINFSGLRSVGASSSSGRGGDGMEMMGMSSGTRRGGSSGRSFRDSPLYLTDPFSSPFSVYNWTSRKCDEQVDVVQFGVTVIIDASQIPVFMKEMLSEKTHNFREGYSPSGQLNTFKHNQITILTYSNRPIDRDAIEHADYRYGDRAVTVLELICEYIFHKDGYIEVMPDVVKTALGGKESSRY